MHGGMRKTQNEESIEGACAHSCAHTGGRDEKLGSAQYADGMGSCATCSSLLHCVNLPLPMPITCKVAQITIQSHANS